MPLRTNRIQDETLLVSGCSYTTTPYYNNNSFTEKDILLTDTWPTLLGFKEVISVADNGLGNDEIINRCIEHLLDHNKPDPDRIIIALSNWDRFDTPYSGYTPGWFMWMLPEEFKRYQSGGDLSDLPKGMEREVSWYEHWGNPHPSTWYKMVTNTIRNILILHNICFRRKISCHIFQLIPPWTWPLRDQEEYFHDPSKEIYNAFFNHHLAKQFLNLRNIDIVGYPFEPKWGGKTFWYDICVENETDGESSGLRLSDGHPSEYGHALIAKKVLKELTYFKLH